MTIEFYALLGGLSAIICGFGLWTYRHLERSATNRAHRLLKEIRGEITESASEHDLVAVQINLTIWPSKSTATMNLYGRKQCDCEACRGNN